MPISPTPLRRLGALLAMSAAAWLALPAQAQHNRIDQIRTDAPQAAAYGQLGVGVRTQTFRNPGQWNIVKSKPGQDKVIDERVLTTEVWYPATVDPAAKGFGEYRVLFRDGRTEISLHGRAQRDAAALPGKGPYPLVLVSHGYPGNRFLLSPIAENLASKGYVVVSIDHTDSTYSDQGDFISTLRNRPLDLGFVIDSVLAWQQQPGSPLQGMIDPQRIGLIGYSMGGYGVMVKLGAGLADRVSGMPNPHQDSLAPLMARNPESARLRDPRIKAAVAIAPWGFNMGFWDAQGLQGVQTPLLFMAGSVDDVSGYAPGVRNLFEGTTRSERYLLTFENANHNAAAPMPAPREASTPVSWLPSVPAAHYIDPVWDNVRMNNIAQHFVTAFFGKYLEQDQAKAALLDLLPEARQGKWSANPDGSFKSDHTYWRGFPNRTAAGLRFEHLPAR